MFRSVGERPSVDITQRVARRRSKSGLESFFDRIGWQTDALVHQAKNRKRIRLGFDVPLVLAVITLLIFGLIIVYSASYDYSSFYYSSPTTIFYRQIVFMLVGVGIGLFMVFFDYHRWISYAVAAMGLTIVLLLGVFVIDDMRNGAVRTLYEGSGQPSELAKFMIVIYLAVWLYSKRDKLHDMSIGFVPLAVILGILGGLIALQPDFSAVITIMILGGLLFFLAGGDLRQIGALIIVAVLVGYSIVMLTETGQRRVQDYFGGLQDPTKASYQVQRSYEAFVKGGWVGQGIGNGDTKLTGLPVPQTDSIFAVVGEETGVFGSTLMVFLYLIVLWRGFSISLRAPDRLGMLLAAGLTLWITIEAFINMAVMVNLLPIAGNALPLVSSGGSSMVLTLASVGILLNISRLSAQSKEEKGNPLHAVVDLRGRDRRRRVSGYRRPASVDGRSSNGK